MASQAVCWRFNDDPCDFYDFPPLISARNLPDRPDIALLGV
jgi:hypothetical protein